MSGLSRECGVIAVDRSEWAARAREHDDYNYRHVWEYGEACAARLGARSEHVRLERGGQVVGLADVRVKRAPVVGVGVAYVSGGPMVMRGGDVKAAREALVWSLRALRERYTRRMGLTLRVSPAPAESGWGEAQAEVYEQEGFAPSSGARHRTILIDLAREESELRTGLAQKWRNCLNAAEREGLEVETGSAASLFDRFTGMYHEIRERKGFDADLGASFFAAVQGRIEDGDGFVVSIVRAGGEDAAGHVGCDVGKTSVYLLGASNDVGRRTKAAYLAQWSVMLRAKASGCRWYDLGGIDAEANPGVYKFKSGMGGVEVEAAGPYEVGATGWRGVVTRAGERAYRWKRSMSQGKRGA